MPGIETAAESRGAAQQVGAVFGNHLSMRKRGSAPMARPVLSGIAAGAAFDTCYVHMPFVQKGPAMLLWFYDPVRQSLCQTCLQD